MGQPAHLKKMTSVKERDRPVQRGQASEAPIGPLSSNQSDNGDHKDPLGSNKLKSFEAPTGPKALVRPKTLAVPKALPRPPQAIPFSVF